MTRRSPEVSRHSRGIPSAASFGRANAQGMCLADSADVLWPWLAGAALASLSGVAG
jgi:hypothetical protein